jgi:hypothetical protein
MPFKLQALQIREICTPTLQRLANGAAAPIRRSVYVAGRARSRLVVGPQHGSGVPCRCSARCPEFRYRRMIAAVGEKMRFLIGSLAEGGVRIVLTRDGGIGPNRPHLISLYAIAGVAEPMGAAEALPAAACHAAAACDMPPARATCSPPLINARNGGLRARQACGPAGLYPAVHAGSGRGCAGGILC